MGSGCPVRGCYKGYDHLTNRWNRKLGGKAEKLAEDFLRQKGYRILEKNYRVSCGEIDLIASKNQLVFVEVKARISTRYGLPQEAVTVSKQRQIIRVAQWYLQAQKWQDKETRFDVIAVRFHKDMRPSIEHIPFAFGLDSF